jgi:hypothetical protein
VLRPQAPSDLAGLPEAPDALAGRVEGDPHALVLVLVPAGADAELETTLGDRLPDGVVLQSFDGLRALHSGGGPPDHEGLSRRAKAADRRRPGMVPVCAPARRTRLPLTQTSRTPIDS